MIIFDTETTSFLKPEVAELKTQPRIIEIAALYVDEAKGYKVIEEFHSLLNPEEPLDEETHKQITGLKDADLAAAPTFLEIIDSLCEFFLAERVLVAHNLEFDRGVLASELRRIGRECAFPWPPTQMCTVNLTKHLLGRRMKLTELYELKLKKPLKQTHRAMDDTRALLEIVKEMKL